MYIITMNINKNNDLMDIIKMNININNDLYYSNEY